MLSVYKGKETEHIEETEHSGREKGTGIAVDNEEAMYKLRGEERCKTRKHTMAKKKNKTTLFQQIHNFL